jgi:Phasin protein
MSEDKQAKAKRTTPPQSAVKAPSIPEPAAVPQPEAATARAQPDRVTVLPAPVAALPAPVPARPRAQADRMLGACHAALASVGAAQAAIAGDVTAMTLELCGLTRANLTAAGDSIVTLLDARTMTDAVEIQLGFARRSLDLMAGGSTRLNELGLRLASNAAKPLLNPFPAG